MNRKVIRLNWNSCLANLAIDILLAGVSMCQIPYRKDLITHPIEFVGLNFLMIWDKDSVLKIAVKHLGMQSLSNWTEVWRIRGHWLVQDSGFLPSQAKGITKASEECFG